MIFNDKLCCSSVRDDEDAKRDRVTSRGIRDGRTTRETSFSSTVVHYMEEEKRKMAVKDIYTSLEEREREL
jgi:hypothetical protein